MYPSLFVEGRVIRGVPLHAAKAVRCAVSRTGWSAGSRLSERPVPAMTIGDTSFDLRAFFVIIPGRDQQEGHGVLGIVILVKDLQRVFEGRAATAVHVAVQAPR